MKIENDNKNIHYKHYKVHIVKDFKNNTELQLYRSKIIKMIKEIQYN